MWEIATRFNLEVETEHGNISKHVSRVKKMQDESEHSTLSSSKTAEE
jgi:hypothetical protein